MDITKENIIMCHKATEIQALWEPAGGDWFIHDYRNTTGSTREFEKQMWGDDDKVWQKVEILCYRPSSVQDVVVTSDEQNSHITSVKDIVKRENTWLPRQDQYQKMVDNQFDWIGFDKQDNLAFYKGYLPSEIVVRGASMEQLWLAFVMKEKYNKVWDGEDWKAK